MKANKQIEVQMLELEKGKAEIDRITVNNKELQDSIMKQFDIECDSEFIVDDGKEKVLSAKLVESNKVDFDFEAIIKNLPKDKLDAIVEKVFVITDQEKFIEIVKNNKGLKDILKPAITLEKRINGDKLDYAFKRKVISEDDLKGCYTTETRRSMRLTRKKR